MGHRLDWKAITIDWDEVSTFDDTEQQSVCLTQMEAAILKALLIPAYWATRWDNLSVSLDALQEKIAHIDGQLDGGCAMFRLQQNPDSPCLLEQSFDGGNTWSLAFDYSLCQTSDSVSIQNIWNTSFIWNETNETTYAGDIINIYPVWEYTGGDDDADNDAALCAAITAWVDMICDATIATIVNENSDIESQTEFWSTITAAMGSAALVASAFGIFPAAGLFAGTGLLLSSIAVVAAGGWQLSNPSPYRNQSARDEVICVMYGALAGLTPTYSDWSTALSASLSGDAEDIREIVHAYNQAEMGFVNWMGFFADMIAVGATSLGNECATCSTFTHIWEIDELSGGDPHTTYNNDAPAWTIISGTYVPSTGIDGADIIEAGKCRHRAKIEQLWSGSRKLTRIRFDYVWAAGDIDDWGATAAVIIINGVIVGNWNFAEVSGNNNKQWTGSKLGCDKVVIALSSSYENENGCGYGGTAVIERVVIEGVGECPFD
jgi:hypothetical protein